MSESSTTIGFIGLGSMGLGMCRNLLDAGFTVNGYDINPDAVAALEAAGGRGADSPADAARGVALLFVCVFSGEQAELALWGEHGALASLPAGAVVIMNTTMAPERVQAMEERITKSGMSLIDSPITGGKAGADDGTLTIMCSGPSAALDRAAKAFEAIGRRVYRVGEAIGAATTVKMVNQLLVGVHLTATAEAMALAAKAGADPRTVYDVITHGGGNSSVFKGRVPEILDRDYEPRGALEIFIKDLGIVTGAGQALGLDLPLSKAALGQFEAAVAAGHGNIDAAAVVKVYEAQGDIDIAAAAERFGRAADEE